MPADRFTLVRDGAVRVYRHDRVQPRAFLVDSFVVLQGDAARRALRGAAVDLTRTVVLDAEPPGTEPSFRTGASVSSLSAVAVVALWALPGLGRSRRRNTAGSS